MDVVLNETGLSSDRIQPFRDPGLGNTSYLVDLGAGLAAVVDPPRDIEPHHAAADRAGLRIVASLETHLHADFVSGSRELADHCGAEVICAQGADLAFAHRSVNDGEIVRLGETDITAIHTPGHTPEHVAYVFGSAGAPRAIFTGGSLIGGGAARTDLISPDRTTDLARAQFRSFRRLAQLPDTVAVHPTHGAGSFCSAGGATKDVGTIGHQRLTNPLFRIDDEERFVNALVSGYGSFPPYFLRLRELNRRGPRLNHRLNGPCPLDAVVAHDLVERGVWLIDARSFHDWAAAHPVGAISNQLRPVFVSWLGWIVPFGDPIVLLIDGDGITEAVRQARGIGYEKVVGWIDGGIDAWQAAGLPIATTDEVAPADAIARRDDGAELLDVRQAAEVALGRIDGATHIELGDIIAGKTPPTDDVVTFCGHGERAATAASILERRGVQAAVMAGGPDELETAALRMER